MSEVTNHLVDAAKAAGRRRLSLSAGALLTGALAVSLIFHESSVRAAGVEQTSPIDDSSIAALYQQRNLLIMLLHHFAQLRDALHRSPIHRKHHIARLNAGFSRAALSIFDHQTAWDAGLPAFLGT